MDDNYVKRAYGVPCDIGRKVTYKGRPGIIYEDGGAYVAVNFDSDKPAHVNYVHPTDPDLVYGDMGERRRLTKAQERYRNWRRSECSETFFEWIKGRMYLHYER